jgi:hypothetical protein
MQQFSFTKKEYTAASISSRIRARIDVTERSLFRDSDVEDAERANDSLRSLP